MFEKTGPHYCPKCISSQKSPLALKIPDHENNTKSYHSAFDIVECPTCKKVFEISYAIIVRQVKQVTDKELVHIYGNFYFLSKKTKSKKGKS
jgi:hypothetical protein